MKKLLNGITKGLPQTGVQGSAGVGVFYIHRMLAAKIPFLQTHALAAPIGFIIAGHILKKTKKLSTAGAALIGAGGYAAAQVFEVKKSVQAAQASAPPAQVSGFEDEDTGALINASDIGMLMQPSGIGDLENESAYSDAYAL